MAEDGTCRWIDLRTLQDLEEESGDSNYREGAFVVGVGSFVRAFGVTIGDVVLRSMDPNPPKEILDQVSAIWQRHGMTSR